MATDDRIDELVRKVAELEERLANIEGPLVDFLGRLAMLEPRIDRIEQMLREHLIKCPGGQAEQAAGPAV